MGEQERQDKGKNTNPPMSVQKEKYPPKKTVPPRDDNKKSDNK